jgi:hypothetical protein
VGFLKVGGPSLDPSIVVFLTCLSPLHALQPIPWERDAVIAAYPSHALFHVSGALVEDISCCGTPWTLTHTVPAHARRSTRRWSFNLAL